MVNKISSHKDKLGIIDVKVDFTVTDIDLFV